MPDHAAPEKHSITLVFAGDDLPTYRYFAQTAKKARRSISAELLLFLSASLDGTLAAE